MRAKELCAVVALLVVTLGCEKSLGICKVGKVGDCPQGTVCYAQANPSPGSEGECVVGELDAEGRLKTTVKNWRVLRQGQEIVPLRFDETEQNADADNLEPGWLGRGAAELQLSALGSVDVEKSLEVIVEGTTYGCEHVAGKCRTANCDWVCHLPEAWAGEGSEVEVEVRLGEQGLKRKRIYRVSKAASNIHVDMDSSALLGERLELCATQEGSAAPAKSWKLQNSTLSGTPLVWTPGTAGTHKACWHTTLPLTVKMGVGETPLNAVILVANDASDLLRLDYEKRLQVERVFCQKESLTGNVPVTQPLAFASSSASKSLVFGAGNQLYFYDTSCKEKETVRSLHSGVVQGPMVVLGGTGQVAVAITEGPAGREGSRLAMVDANLVKFSYGRERDCDVNAADEYGYPFFAGEGEVPVEPLFDKGLALIQMGNASSLAGWLLAAPAIIPKGGYSKDDAYMTTFWPEQTVVSKRCQATAAPGRRRSLLTPVQPIETARSIAETLVVAVFKERYSAEDIRDIIGYWRPLASGYYFGGTIVGASVTWGVLAEPTGLAAANGNVWISGQGLQRWDFIKRPSFTLQSWQDVPPGILMDVQLNMKTSPAVIDEQGRAYVVVETSPNVYQLRRFSAQANTRETPEAFVSLPAGVSEPVGSPLLGQPIGDSPAEMYVVTTQGTVLAFEADQLALLWTMELGIPISREAQPLLMGNLLWVMGTQGEVRALRVGSNGLNRSAQWPKAFRDNCNTSSRQANHDYMPACFL